MIHNNAANRSKVVPVAPVSWCSRLCIIHPRECGKALELASDQQNSVNMLGCHSYNWVTWHRTPPCWKTCPCPSLSLPLLVLKNKWNESCSFKEPNATTWARKQARGPFPSWASRWEPALVDTLTSALWNTQQRPSQTMHRLLTYRHHQKQRE